MHKSRIYYNKLKTSLYIDNIRHEEIIVTIQLTVRRCNQQYSIVLFITIRLIAPITYQLRIHDAIPCHHPARNHNV